MSTPQTPAPVDTVALAEQLLELVKSLPQDENTLTAWNTRTAIQNVSDKLLATVMGPKEHAILLAESCQESEAMFMVSALGVADLIEDGKSTLLELSAASGVDPQFLGVAMSCLIGRGYFEEVGGFGSRVYKNNAFSVVLRDGQPGSVKQAIEFIGDDGLRATSRLLDAANISPNAVVGQKRLPAVNIAFDFETSVFAWMSSPEQAWRGKRLGKAMQQLHAMANVNVAEDYPWKDLSSPIVDIGAGIGSLEMNILEYPENKHLDFILFDIPKTMENAEKAWSSNPLRSNMTFVPGNFMSQHDSNIPQGKLTYIIRHVLHDWTDHDVVFILSAVRKAMAPHGRILLVEMLLREDSSRFVRTTSMQLLALNSGVTRTLRDLEAVVIQAGLKIVKTTNMRAVDSVIECTL